MLDKVIVWSEPQLKFKLGIQESIIDPKVGLLSHGPLDFNSRKRRFSKVRLGVICKEPRRIINFLNKLNSFIPPQKVGDQPYKGFQLIYKVPIEIPCEDEIGRITDSDLSGTLSLRGKSFEQVVELYDQKIQEFHDEMRGRYDVLVIQIPRELSEYEDPRRSRKLWSSIKAAAIRKNIVTQIITEKTLTSKYDCDNMWNLSLALYVKAGGVPWMLKKFTDTESFIGIAYGIKKFRDGQRVLSGLAEIFDEFGEHVSVVSITSEAFGKDFTLETDGSYHLSEEKTALLIEKLIEEYKRKIGNPPRKVVIHKTTFFNRAEKEGVKEALSKFDSIYDLVNIVENPSLRFFTAKKNPPQRGTFLRISAASGLIYTTGYVKSFKTYPGIGIPKPLEFHLDEGKSEPHKIAKEILALTKMDWNTTHLMIRKPVTIKYASRIVDILKSGLRPHELVKDIRYYM
ncbi:hypothetical protein DRN63_00390 [Nanoarchaeota archaeon]|nr:MAG: hypothetical protein DRN63_00390 [Nanoarchaeota archaeon]